MQYKFYIQGITCNNCVNKITQLLNNEFAALNVLFRQNNTQIEFNSESHISVQQLNEQLAKIGNYTVSSDGQTTGPVEHNPQGGLSYKPIYLLFTYLIVTNILIAIHGISLEMFMANFMASFFLVFSFFKLLDLKGFADGYATYDILARKFYFYGYIYPFLELGFAIGYLLIGKNIYLNIVVFVVMLLASVGVIKAKLSKQRFYCACVGTFLKVPLGNIAIIEDVTMVVMSLIMILQLSHN